MFKMFRNSRRSVLHRIVACLTISTALLGAGSASAEIVGALEAPSGFASGVSNIQGWAYTNTPGAELIQPFEVYMNGVQNMTIPCCGDRGDVQDAYSDAPLQTGFSGVYNWGRKALSTPQVTVEVVIRDTAGGELRLTKTVDLYKSSSFKFDREVKFDLDQGWCESSNESSAVEGAASMRCYGLMYASAEDEEVCAGYVEFSWDRATQGFRQSSDCIESDAF